MVHTLVPTEKTAAAPPGRTGPTAQLARLFSAPWVLPITTPPLCEGAVLVDGDGTIIAVGPRTELRAAAGWVEERRCPGAAIMPALVNAHLHLELSHRAEVRARPPGQGFLAWVEPLLSQAAAPDANVAAAALFAAHTLQAAGVGAVGDVGNGLAGVTAIAALGLAGTFFHELTSGRDARTGDALADAERERAAHTARHGWPSPLAYTLAPHAPYSLDPGLFRRLFAANAAAGRLTSVHVAEDADELALLARNDGGWPARLAALGVDSRRRSPGLSPLRYLAALGIFATGTPPLLVHMTFATADEIGLAAEAGACVVLCPRSNLHISGRLPDLATLVAAGVPLAIGTDSLASSPTLSPWGELATLHAHSPDIPPSLWLAAATRGGARALRLPGHGAIVAGQRPGLIAIETAHEPADTTSLERLLVSDPAPRVSWLTGPGAATPPHPEELTHA